MTNLKTQDFLDSLDLDLDGLLSMVESLEITDKLSSDSWTHILNKVNTSLKMIEDTRKYIVKPYNDIVKQINAKAKEKKSWLDDLKTDIKFKILEYQTKLEKLKEEKDEEMKQLAKDNDVDIKDWAVVSELNNIEKEYNNEKSKWVYRDYEIVSVDKKKLDWKYLEVKEWTIRTDLRKWLNVEWVEYKKIKKIK